MEPLNIMHSEWSNGWGGQEIRILSECQGMAARGHRVALCGCPQGELREAASAAGLSFHPLAMRGPWDLGAIAGMVRLLKREKVDLLNTHSSVDGWVGGMAARLAGVASVRTRHLSARVPGHPFNFVYRLPQAVSTTGEGIRCHLIEDYGLSPERVVSIPTGVDTARYAPAPPDAVLAAELGLRPGVPVVAIVAILRSWKRHDLFLAMARLLLAQGRDLQFMLVGGGPKEQEIRGLVSDLGLTESVVMTGMRADVERILPLCAVCVLSSDKNEGVPQAVLQQMAASRPVVAAAAGDVGQVVIDGQTGLLVPPGDPAALAAGVVRLLDDAELAARLGAQGREMVLARYSLGAMLDATEGLYARVLAGAGFSARFHWWRPARRGAPMFMYHQIRADLENTPLPKLRVRPGRFAAQLDALARRGYSPVSLSQALGPDSPAKAAVLTFDDAYQDFYDTAWPLLAERGMGATVFVITSQIGGSNAWDQGKGIPTAPLMDAEQIKELAGQGVEFGGHGHSHADLTALDDAALASDLAACSGALAGVLGAPPRVFSYPYGSFDERVKQAVSAAGFRAACTIQPSLLTPASDPMALGRIMVKRSDTALDFALKLSRGRSRW